MTLLFYFIGIVYLITAGSLSYFWTRIGAFIPSNSPDDTSLPGISVIVPVRNESGNIEHLLEDIEKEHYPRDKFEVIVVDDHSEDDTFQKVERLKQIVKYQLSIISLQAEGIVRSYKKKAIETGISRAKYELILTTDGDCRTGPQRLRSFGEFYRQHRPKLISGPVCYHQEKTSFEKLQGIEFLSLIGAGAASMKAGIPNMCNGANLAYEKKAFEEVGGFQSIDDIASGDDELLLHKIAAKYPKEIQFLKSKEAVVYTEAKRTWKDFYFQRKRWAGKWSYYKKPEVLLLSLVILLFNLSLLVSFMLAASGKISFRAPLALFALKVVAEGVFTQQIADFFNKKLDFTRFMLLQLLYPIYMPFLSIVASFGSYEWKGRKVI